jgi:phthiocerol/phenolphthiocerol synthesis type-I polyketide synthase C
VLHAAAVFDDALIKNLEPPGIETVIAPKLLGAWNLHQATLSIPLEYFVLYSSIATAIGNPGQANYVAANAGLEGLAEMRRHMGLPGVCVGWGPIGDAGYLTRKEGVRESLSQRLGKEPLSAREALNQLHHILSQEPSLAIANFEWNTLSRLLPSANSQRFSVLNRSLKSENRSENTEDFEKLIAGKSRKEVSVLVQELVFIEVARTLQIRVEQIDTTLSLQDLGLDSLMAIELALGLERRFGIQLPMMMLSDFPTLEKVTELIVGRLLDIPDTNDVDANTSDREVQLDSIAQHMSRQHDEVVTAEDILQIAKDAEALKSRDRRPAI